MNALPKKLATSFAYITLSITAQAEADYFQTSVPQGVLIINQTSGQINYCVASYNPKTYAPNGKCPILGQFPSANLSGNIKVDIPTGANFFAFITNTRTGITFQCTLTLSTPTREPTGKCIQTKPE